MGSDLEWIFLKAEAGEDFSELKRETSLPSVLLSILYQRGRKRKEEIEKFLEPKLAHLENPLLLPDCEKAIFRIKEAIEKGEKILIYGDYDVDGITGTALLVRILSAIYPNVAFYLPSREKEGYGLSITGVMFARSHGFSLIITVDCGTTDFPSLSLAKKLGIDVIVCDHHQPKREKNKDKLPSAYAVVNAKREGAKSKTHLSGCGVAFKMIWGFLSQFGYDKRPLLENLDLVALSTICDIVPLTNENRIIAKIGLERLPRTKNLGIKALSQVAGLKLTSLTSYHISYILGPRLNASGRIADATKAVKLLLTRDEKEAEALAKELNEHNKERQAIERSILQEAEGLIEKEGWAKRPVIVLKKEGWHEGVIGIVAQKLRDLFYAPVILITIKDGVGKGSGRSIPGFSLYDALLANSSSLLRFGGHKYACGLALSVENINKFILGMERYAERFLTPELRQRKLFIDAEISLNEVSQELLKFLAKLEPFGLENPMPIFATRGLEVVGFPRVIGKEHLKFTVREDKKKVFDCLAFGRHDDILRLVPGKENHIDIAYTFAEDNFFGKKKIKLLCEDLKIRE